MRLRLQVPQADDDIDLTAMIDAVFLLVLFFMVTSTFIEEAQAFKITLPKADQAQTISTEEAHIITVSSDGRYKWRGPGGKDADIDDLNTLLPNLKPNGITTEHPVILRGDAHCEYWQVVQVKNVLKLAGVETIFEQVEVRHGKDKP